MHDCGHACCAIRENRYHEHLEPPDCCRACRAATLTGPSPPPAGSARLHGRRRAG